LQYSLQALARFFDAISLGFLNTHERPVSFGVEDLTMKRKSREDIPVDPQSTGNIKIDLTETQLAAFGASVLAYNVLEDQIDTLLLVATRIPDWLFVEVSSRIHGLDGKIAIIRKAINQSGLGPNDAKTLNGAIDVFLDFKKTRDTLIHARIINASLGVGRGPNQRGKSPFEILLSAQALNAFYDHIITLQIELASGGRMLNSAVALKQCAVDDPNKSRFEEEILTHKAQFLENHKHRLALTPLPKFPDEDELREATNRWRETQILMRMGYPLPPARDMSQFWYHRNNALLNTYYPSGADQEPSSNSDNKEK
jgi:hypothetical protein